MERRDFLKGCCAAAAGSTLMPAAGFFNPLAYGAGVQHDVVVYLFLRGGIDGLHLVVPYAGPERAPYEATRDSLAIPEANLRQVSADWGLHPRTGGAAGDPVGAAPKWLHRLWEDNRLAIVHAAGMPTTVTRSHFDAQAYMDLGTPGDKSTPTGWMTRYMAAATGLPEPLLSHAFGFASNQPQALRGSTDAFTVSNAEEFRIDGFHWSWNSTDIGISGHEAAHKRLFPLWLGGAGSDLGRAGRLAAEALEYMREIDFAGYQPEGGAEYPDNNLGTQLRNLAQLIKLDTGIVGATLDYGGWDTHESQGMPDPGNPDHYDYYGNRVEGLARAVYAFYRDLSQSGQGNFMQRVNVVIQSEFGRRFRTNASGGTDHGYGNVMMAVGDRVNPGFHGTFPGLDSGSLFEGKDLQVTTDYRDVLAEALVRRLGLPSSDLPEVFPGLDYQPPGVFQ